MGQVRTADPTEEPLSLEEAKLHLKLDATDDDELVFGLIAAARASAEDYTGRALITQTWQLKIDGDWLEVDEPCGHRIVLPRPPIASVASVQYVDTACVTH